LFQKITSFGESLLWEGEINSWTLEVDGRELDMKKISTNES